MGVHVSEKHTIAMHTRMFFAAPILFDIEGFCNPCKQGLEPQQRTPSVGRVGHVICMLKKILIQKSGLGMDSKSFVVVLFIFPGLNDATAQLRIRDLQAEVVNPGPRTLPIS